MIAGRLFGTGEITQFAAVTNDNLQNWLKRGAIVGHRDIKGGGAVGQRRQFSWFNLMEIATAAGFLQLGLSSPALAFKAAQAFAHGGTGGFAWESDEGVLGGTAKRLPGFPHHHKFGATFIILAAGESQIILSKDGALTSTVLGEASSIGCVVLNATVLFATVVHRMGDDYRQVLDEAYADDLNL